MGLCAIHERDRANRRAYAQATRAALRADGPSAASCAASRAEWRIRLEMERRVVAWLTQQHARKDPS